MVFKKLVRKIALSSVVALVAIPAAGQDLMARQAPVDQRSKAVDPVALQSVMNRENSENPSSDLYEEWENRRTHAVYELPDVYKINLQGFHMPTSSRVVTSGFGRRWGRMHKGLDIKVYIGDTIRAAFSGKIRIVRYEPRGYGNYVVIRHNNGLETVYGHMSKHLVKENQMVRAGQAIGLGGNTGRSTGSHLHFETRLCGVALNPALMFDFANQDVTCDVYTFRKNGNGSTYSAPNRQQAKTTQNASPAPKANDAQTTNSPKSNEPVASSKNSDYRWHTVAAGESLESIAQTLGLSVEELCRMNEIGRFTPIRKGQHLRYKN